MALYIPAARRRRKLLVVGVAAGVIGLGAGMGVGRITAPSAAASASTAKAAAKVVTGQLRSLPLEYEKATLDPSTRPAFDASLTAGMSRANDNLSTAFVDAPWIDPERRGEVRQTLDAIGAAAAGGVPPAEFERVVEAAADAVDAAFGS